MKTLDVVGHTPAFTFTSDSCGYMLYFNGNPIGGARTLGTATRTSSGTKRHWRNIAKDRVMHAETARRECAELIAGRGQPRFRAVIAQATSTHP
jgi:hypothetical protein